MDLRSEYVSTNGIAQVTFSWIGVTLGAVLTLAFNATSQQVVLLTSEPSVFNSKLFQSPIHFNMTLTDSSPQCIAFGQSPMYGHGCSSTFEVSVLALTETSCPAVVDVVLSNISSPTQRTWWNEPQLQYYLPLVSTVSIGDAFPLGVTTVRYVLASSVQSPIQSSVSRLLCQFNVCPRIRKFIVSVTRVL